MLRPRPVHFARRVRLSESPAGGTEAERAADGRYVYGLQWAEERDIREVQVQFRAGSSPQPAVLEYWFRNWPYAPPAMPTIEDPVDDPWQGQWLKAVTNTDCRGRTCTYTFAALAESENPLAKNLPGLAYRRALKLRLVFGAPPDLEKVEVFSGSTEKRIEVRLQLGAGETAAHTWEGSFKLYNGLLESVRVWNPEAGDAADARHFHVVTAGSPKGLILNLLAAEPSLPGSSDVTIVTFRAGDRTFSFAIPDIEKGPVYVPDFHVGVSLASETSPFSPEMVEEGAKIREKLAKEPEQTYERARKEIPALDPTEREGEPLYLPLAADASWQKFAFEWGGSIHISKEGTKAKGKELKRLEWQGDRIAWRIGTGATPDYHSGWKDSALSVLDDYLPIATAKWTTDGIEYTEEGFATLLSGPLSPRDPQRSEESPAVLMLKLTAHNPTASAAAAHLGSRLPPRKRLDTRTTSFAPAAANCCGPACAGPRGPRWRRRPCLTRGRMLAGVHAEISLGPGETKTTFIAIPYIPRLTADEAKRLAELDYDGEHGRVEAYWKGVVDHAVPFNVPEPRFNSFAKAVIPHIRISATKDPASGFYMVPAASYYYTVFANEAAFQCVMLDALGDHALAAEYLKTFVQLQGSKKFDGTFTGDQKVVYHGVRVNADYDYTAAEYNLDHGTVLWALAEHYFYTRDKAWLEKPRRA